MKITRPPSRNATGRTRKERLPARYLTADRVVPKETFYVCELAIFTRRQLEIALEPGGQWDLEPRGEREIVFITRIFLFRHLLQTCSAMIIHNMHLHSSHAWARASSW
jgi:hypothetical protein